MTTDRTGGTAVTERLERLESQNRRLRLGLIAITLGLGVTFLAAVMPSTTQTVTAQQFVVADAGGDPRIILDVDKEGQPGLIFSDAAHDPRAHLTLAKDGEPRFVLFDASGKSQLLLGSVGLPSPTQGGTEITPVASITAFDQNGNVIDRWPHWSAPEAQPQSAHPPATQLSERGQNRNKRHKGPLHSRNNRGVVIFDIPTGL